MRCREREGGEKKRLGQKKRKDRSDKLEPKFTVERPRNTFVCWRVNSAANRSMKRPAGCSKAASPNGFGSFSAVLCRSSWAFWGECGEGDTRICGLCTIDFLGVVIDAWDEAMVTPDI